MSLLSQKKFSPTEWFLVPNYNFFCSFELLFLAYLNYYFSLFELLFLAYLNDYFGLFERFFLLIWKIMFNVFICFVFDVFCCWYMFVFSTSFDLFFNDMFCRNNFLLLTWLLDMFRWEWDICFVFICSVGNGIYVLFCYVPLGMGYVLFWYVPLGMGYMLCFDMFRWEWDMFCLDMFRCVVSKRWAWSRWL